MPKKSKALAVVEPEPAAIEIPGRDDAGKFVKYLMLEASSIGRDQIMLNALADTANKRTAVMDGLQEWARAEGLAIAATVVRKVMDERGAMPAPSRPRTIGKPELSEEAKQELQLQPFFCSREEATVLRSVLPLNYQRKWAAYHDAWGCVICGDRKAPHASCGMCNRCRLRVTARLQRVMWQLEPNGQPCPELAEEDSDRPPMPPGVEVPKPRRCEACGKRFKPMHDRVWKTMRPEHEQSKRHRDAVKRQKGQAA